MDKSIWLLLAARYGDVGGVKVQKLGVLWHLLARLALSCRMQDLKWSNCCAQALQQRHLQWAAPR